MPITYTISLDPTNGYCVDAFRDGKQWRYWRDEIEQIYLLYGRDAELVTDSDVFGILTDELKDLGLLAH